MDKLSLNIGCGENRLEGFINIDCVENNVVKPDLVLDILTQNLPYDAGTVDEIWMIHALEHIEMRHWAYLLQGFKNVLKDNGALVLSYPEFGECSKRFLNDTNKQRNFWRATLYGRQLYDSDYHVVPMHSDEIKEILEVAGFYRINYRPESTNEPYNTIMCGYKNPAPITREQVLIRELNLQVCDKLEFADKLG